MRKRSSARRARQRRIVFRKCIVAAAALGLIAAIALLIRGCCVLMGRTDSESTSTWEYSGYAEAYSEEYDVPLEIVYAVIETESGFDENARSSVGACGLMQLMPDTYDWILWKLGLTDVSVSDGMAEGNAEEAVSNETAENKSGIFDPETNIRCGVYYLSYLYERFGVWETAYAGYNAGPSIVSRWLSDERYSDDGLTLSSIPYNETANYVVKVSEARERYKKLLDGSSNSSSD